MELTLTSYLLLEHLPSDLAAAAVLVAQWALGSAPWTPTLSFYTRKTPADLELVAHRGAFLCAAARACNCIPVLDPCWQNIGCHRLCMLHPQLHCRCDPPYSVLCLRLSCEAYSLLRY